MDIRFSGKHLSVTEGMKEHTREKLIRLERYAPRLVETHVLFKKEKYFYYTEMTLLAKNLRAYGEGTSKENIYASIDQAYAHIEKQLKKFREKIKDHHKGGEENISSAKKRKALRGLTEVVSEQPSIVKSASFAVKPMTPEEASLQLAIGKKPFLVFLNPSTRQVNVIYRREDGNHGLIEPSFKK